MRYSLFIFIFANVSFIYTRSTEICVTIYVCAVHIFLRQKRRPKRLFRLQCRFPICERSGWNMNRHGKISTKFIWFFLCTMNRNYSLHMTTNKRIKMDLRSLLSFTETNLLLHFSSHSFLIGRAACSVQLHIPNYNYIYTALPILWQCSLLIIE